MTLWLLLASICFGSSITLAVIAGLDFGLLGIALGVVFGVVVGFFSAVVGYMFPQKWFDKLTGGDQSESILSSVYAGLIYLLWFPWIFLSATFATYCVEFGLSMFY